MLTDKLIKLYSIDVPAETESLRLFLDRNDKLPSEFAAELFEQYDDKIDEIEDSSDKPTVLGVLHNYLGRIAAGELIEAYSVIACWNVVLSEQIGIEERKDDIDG